MSKPLSEELRDLAVDGTLRRWADRAAALESEVEELHALREALADWWDPLGAGPERWTAENAREQLTHLQRNIDAMREVIEEIAMPTDEQVQNDLRAVRNNLAKTEEAAMNRYTHDALVALLQAVKPLARLVAEAHGFDEFGERIEEGCDDG